MKSKRITAAGTKMADESYHASDFSRHAGATETAGTKGNRTNNMEILNEMNCK
jgi:hypothetical protein